MSTELQVTGWREEGRVKENVNYGVVFLFFVFYTDHGGSTIKADFTKPVI